MDRSPTVEQRLDRHHRRAARRPSRWSGTRMEPGAIGSCERSLVEARRVQTRDMTGAQGVGRRRAAGSGQADRDRGERAGEKRGASEVFCAAVEMGIVRTGRRAKYRGRPRTGQGKQSAGARGRDASSLQSGDSKAPVDSPQLLTCERDTNPHVAGPSVVEDCCIHPKDSAATVNP